jgi:hypothetical protein
MQFVAKQEKHEANRKQIVASFMVVSCLDYSLVLKMVLCTSVLLAAFHQTIYCYDFTALCWTLFTFPIS